LSSLSSPPSNGCGGGGGGGTSLLLLRQLGVKISLLSDGIDPDFFSDICDTVSESDSALCWRSSSRPLLRPMLYGSSTRSPQSWPPRTCHWPSSWAVSLVVAASDDSASALPRVSIEPRTGFITSSLWRRMNGVALMRSATPASASTSDCCRSGAAFAESATAGGDDVAVDMGGVSPARSDMLTP
jgi:hypothetical protein